ncbi:ergosterol biosynthesis protein [Acarospora aff. strigata]|nr:ergosterol biosynthesis protein [Acarospora aff. strigata]
MSSYLPSSSSPGYLPSWLLLISLISALNSLQCYIDLSFPRRVYTGAPPSSSSTPSPSTSPVTPLSARTFGTWTFLSSIIRLYAAYNISNPVVYQLALWTYGIALVHFGSEWLVFGTARMGKGLGAAVVVASTSFCWMVGQWGWYVR